MPPVFNIDTDERYGELWLLVEGELDLATAPLLSKQIIDAECTDGLAIVLDLSQVSFMDSTGVLALLEADARSRQDGNRLRLCPVAAPVERVLKLSGDYKRLAFIA